MQSWVAWARTTIEPTIITAGGVIAILGVLRSARDALNVMRMCIRFDINKLSTLIGRIPSLTNVQAEVEIRTLILELQQVIAQSPATCDRGASLSSLFVTGRISLCQTVVVVAIRSVAGAFVFCEVKVLANEMSHSPVPDGWGNLYSHHGGTKKILMLNQEVIGSMRSKKTNNK